MDMTFGTLLSAAAITAVVGCEHPGLGVAARAAMERSYAWDATLGQLDALLDSRLKLDDKMSPAKERAA
jgi:hypothetical protein